MRSAAGRFVIEVFGGSEHGRNGLHAVDLIQGPQAGEDKIGVVNAVRHRLRKGGSERFDNALVGCGHRRSVYQTPGRSATGPAEPVYTYQVPRLWVLLRKTRTVVAI